MSEVNIKQLEVLSVRKSNDQRVALRRKRPRRTTHVKKALEA